MTEAYRRNPGLEQSRGLTPWPDQVWIDPETNEKIIRPPLEDGYMFGNPEWPIAPYRDYIVDTVSRNRVTVLSSGTGNGKSIFVPQALYESGHFRRVFITQPRIIATRENTEFIKYQMGQALGRDMSDVVAYRTATEGDDILPSHKILQHTDGYMLQQMIDEDSQVITEDDVLIVDEAHEQNPNIDLAIALSHRRGIRLLIQSATFDAERVANYCSRARGGIRVPIITVPGLMYPVEERVGGALQDEIIKYAQMDPENPLNIMSLVPGKHETEEAISRTMKRLPNGYTTLKLNGDQTIQEQRRNMLSYPEGKSSIATEIARTSLTVPDWDVVLDGGYQRIGDYRLGVKALRVKPITHAGMIQGKGRVGRTKPGIYSLVQIPGYPPIPRDTNGELMIDRYSTPPIQRTDLSPYVLRLARGGIWLNELDLPNPLRNDEMEYAHHKLVRLGAQALNVVALTEIGEQMAELPLEPHYARMLVESRRYGKDVELLAAAMVSACQQDGITMTEKNLEHWRQLSHENRSDMLVQLDVLAKCFDMKEADLHRFDIVEQRLAKTKRLLGRLCDDAELDISRLKVPNETERQALLGCIIAGADTLFTSRGYGMYSNEDGFEGRLAKSTELVTNTGLIVGTPLILEHYRNKNKKTHSIVVGATVVTAEQLEAHAPWRCSYDNERLIVDENGTVIKARDLYFDGKATRSVTYQNVEADTETTGILLEKLFYDSAELETTSKKVQQLYDEIDRLRTLLIHRSDNVGKFDEHLGILEQNIKMMPDIQVRDMHMLAEILHRRNVYDRLKKTYAADSYETKEILRNSPDSAIVSANDELHEADVLYWNNEAYVDIPFHLIKHIDPDSIIEQLGGRSVYVWVDGAKKNAKPILEAIEHSTQGNRATRRAATRKP